MNNRQIDAQVAQHIFGIDLSVAPEHDWERNEDDSIDTVAWDAGFHNGPLCKRCNYSFCVHCEDDAGYAAIPCEAEPLSYTTDIAAAWQVLEALNRNGWYVSVLTGPVGATPVVRLQMFDADGITVISDDTRADTVPMAICLAALKAVGVEVDTDA